MEKFNLNNVKKILIVKMSSIGDVIHALPTAAALRKYLPEVQLSWIVEPKAYDLVKNHPDLDEVILFDLASINKKIKKLSTFPQALQEIKEIKKRLEKEKFDLVLDLQGLLKSGLISSFTKAPIRLVYCINREGSKFFATHVVPARKETPHIIQKYLDTLVYLGLPIQREDEYQFHLQLTKEEEKFAEQFLTELQLNAEKKIIGVNPATAWPTKNWPPEHYAKLADLLSEKNCQVLFFGSPADKKLVERIQQQMHYPAYNCAGQTTLPQLAAIIKKCAVFLGGDTGPMHLAVAVGTPVVALFGPTDPFYSGPLGPLDLVISKNMPCSPCFKVNKCPLYPKTKCLEEITSQEVAQAMFTLL